MELIWVAVLGLAVLVVEAYRYVRVERIQESCRQSLQNIRNSHDELMRQIRREITASFARKIEGLEAQLANRDAIVEGLEEKLDDGRQASKDLEQRFAEETGTLRKELARTSEFCQVVQEQLRQSHEREEALRMGIHKAKEFLEIAE